VDSQQPPEAHLSRPFLSVKRSTPSTPEIVSSADHAVGPVGLVPEEVKIEEVVTTCVLPSLMDIFATSIPTVKRIPQQCRVPIAKAFTTVMRRCSVSGTSAQEMRAWQLHFLFAKCVLRQQPEIRGGKKKKLKRNETLRDGLLDRLKRWNDGQVDALWAEACKLYCTGERQMKAHSMASNIKRATECAQDARYGKAVAG
jgi:hypothetical protein